MGCVNQTIVTEFFLIGLSQDPRTEILLFILFFTMYLLTIFGNIILIYTVTTNPQMHTPMYYFLCNLSVLDLFYSSTTVPKMLLDMLSIGGGRISLLGCLTQMCTYIFLGEIECILLAVMAYDRYVAICFPLRYKVIMSWKLCKNITVLIWVGSCIFSTLPTNLRPPVFCKGNRIDHFICEVIALVKLVCGDTSFYETIIFSGSLFTLLVPFLCVITSYTFIIHSILKINSAGGRTKSFSTCASHLAVVLMFYGTSTAMYLGPLKNTSRNQKYIAIIYGIVTPMVNPFIYSLRNKDVKETALKILKMECFHNR
ncbi:olfactory receptor 13-like [Spea bombifrons]|uniref:olfactory receptor 13-like n=1 Tax=Spea bombifrons TaxID=233779 RepID=UPI002349F12F|nr:olfactory receptor 13-like [Spea bombifrons]